MSTDHGTAKSQDEIRAAAKQHVLNLLDESDLWGYVYENEDEQDADAVYAYARRVVDALAGVVEGLV